MADKVRGKSGKAFLEGALSGLAGPAAVAAAMSETPASGSRFRRRGSGSSDASYAVKTDYKDSKLLMRYVLERGKLVPSRTTTASVKKQRELARAIKRARLLGLLPYTIR
jgi:small subunit ribosomal protein S18